MWTTSSLWWVLWWGQGAAPGCLWGPGSPWALMLPPAAGQAGRGSLRRMLCPLCPNLPMHRTSGKKNKKTDGTSVEGLRSDAQLGHAATAPLSKELRPCFTGSTSLHGLQVPQSSRAGGGSCKTYQENNLEHPWNVSRVYLRLFDGCECQEESYSVHGRCRL